MNDDEFIEALEGFKGILENFKQLMKLEIGERVDIKVKGHKRVFERVE